MHDRLSAPPPIRFNPERGRATVANTSSIVRQKLGVRSSAETVTNGKSSRTLQEAEKH